MVVLLLILFYIKYSLHSQPKSGGDRGVIARLAEKRGGGIVKCND